MPEKHIDIITMEVGWSMSKLKHVLSLSCLRFAGCDVSQCANRAACTKGPRRADSIRARHNSNMSAKTGSVYTAPIRGGDLHAVS